MIYMMMLIYSFIMILMKHPLTCGMILMFQTILIALITGMMNYNFWYSYILFLIMIGGLLILFLYMTSIASNEKFKFNNKLFLLTLMSLLLMISLFLLDHFYFNYLNQISDTKINMMTNSISMNKYLNFPNNFMMIMMIIYLFLTLIAIVKITNFSYGSMRQKF
uniref:NADH-ubiquinone oxidoreductase chain 6 n=1 Tax=Orestia punctipennis TaxID=1425626 RepID=A0A3G1GQM1_9CUCU|nr:NADH dehydrogenase subunit 6 [Orestia punctipennis]